MGNYYDIGVLKLIIKEFNSTKESERTRRFYFEKDGKQICISLYKLPRAKGNSRFAFRILEESEKDDLKRAREEELSSLRNKEREKRERNEQEKRADEELFKKELAELFKEYFGINDTQANEAVGRIPHAKLEEMQEYDSGHKQSLDITKDQLQPYLYKVVGGKKRPTKKRRPTKRRRLTKRRRPTKRRRLTKRR